MLDDVLFCVRVEFELMEISRQGGPSPCSIKSSLLIRKRGVGGRMLQHIVKNCFFVVVSQLAGIQKKLGTTKYITNGKEDSWEADN